MNASSNQHDVDNPVALVTGAGRRVGNVIARTLAARGYRLALHSNQSGAEAEATARQLSAQGIEVLTLSADLRDERSTRAMFATIRERYGRIDALVNNAAIWTSKPLEAVRAGDVEAHFEVNTLATFICCQEAGLTMVEQPSGGAIVNIGDWATMRPYLGYAAYFAAKGSIPTLTRTFAVELGTRNPRVRVNAVLPGPVELPEGMSPEERQRTIAATLVKREGTAQELAEAVCFLLENTFVTGVSLRVDGGRGVYAPAIEE